MKRFSFRVLFLLMVIALAFFTMGCVTPSTSEGQSESTKESVSQSVKESQSEAKESSSEETSEGGIIGAGENGEVNLSDALDILAPVLNNDYITVNFTIDSGETANQIKTANKTTATAFVKRTLDGYDVIVTVTQKEETQGQSKDLASISLYYVDGIAVFGFTDAENPEIVWNKMEVGSFNSLISQLNRMIASDEDALATYKEVMKAVEKLEVILSEEDLTNVNLAPSFDIAQILSKAFNFVLANKEENVYDFLLASVWGVDVSNPDAVATFENEFMDWCATNPVVADLIDDVIEGINDAIIDNARAEAEANGVPFDESAVFQINLEQLLGLLQEQTGMSTAQIIGFIKSEIPELDDYLTAPEAGETLYDYLSVRMQMITVDDLAKAVTGDSEATMLTALWGLKQKLSSVTVGAYINNVLNDILGEIGEFNPDGDSQTGVASVDYLAMIEESNFSLQAFVVGVTFKTDAYGRPIEFGQSNRIQASLVNPNTGLTTDIITVEIEEVLKASLSYSPIIFILQIPQEILDAAVEYQPN